MSNLENGGFGMPLDDPRDVRSQKRWIVQLGIALTLFVVVLECFRFTLVYAQAPKVEHTEDPVKKSRNDAQAPPERSMEIREQIENLSKAAEAQQKESEAISTQAKAISEAATKLSAALADESAAQEKVRAMVKKALEEQLKTQTDQQANVLKETSGVLRLIEKTVSWQFEEADVVVVAFDSADVKVQDYRDVYRNTLIESPARNMAGKHRIGLVVVEGKAATVVLPLTEANGGDVKPLEVMQTAWDKLKSRTVSAEGGADPAGAASDVLEKISKSTRDSLRIVLVVTANSPAPPSSTWPGLKIDVVIVNPKAKRLGDEKVNDWSEFALSHSGILAQVRPLAEDPVPTNVPTQAADKPIDKPNTPPPPPTPGTTGTTAKPPTTVKPAEKPNTPAPAVTTPTKAPVPKSLQEDLERTLRRLTRPSPIFPSKSGG